MGIKKLKYLIIGLFIIFLMQNVSFASNTYIPVRVGIGNQNFKTFNYNNISLFVTDNASIYEKDTNNLLYELVPENQADISLKDGIYTIKVNDNSITTDKDFCIKSEKGLIGVVNLVRRGKQALYKNSFEIIKKDKDNNLFYLVNVLDIQDYLKGVVPNEMPVHFGLEALKAQAVAARNYVLTPRTKLVQAYDVVDSVASQVYYGANTENELSDKAVDETEGIVATYKWELILAQYSSTAGGYTESYSNAFSDPVNKKFPSSSKPYLIAKADMLSQPPLVTEEDVRQFYMTRPESYDMRSPYYRWTKEWTIDEFNEMIAKTLVSQSNTGFVYPKIKNEDDFGELVSIKPISRGESGKLTDVEIVSTKNTFDVQKELVIRRVFQKNNISLPSANVVFEIIKDEDGKITGVTAYGGGFGHGVGMSQYGAGFMAKELHMPYDKILKHYYTGVSLTSIPLILSAHPTQREYTQNIYIEHKKANLVVDNRFNLSKINLIINGKSVSMPLTKGVSALREPLKIDISYLLNRGKNTITFKYPDDESSYKAARVYIEVENPNADKFGF